MKTEPSLKLICCSLFNFPDTAEGPEGSVTQCKRKLGSNSQHTADSSPCFGVEVVTDVLKCYDSNAIGFIDARLDEAGQDLEQCTGYSILATMHVPCLASLRLSSNAFFFSHQSLYHVWDGLDSVSLKPFVRQWQSQLGTSQVVVQSSPMCQVLTHIQYLSYSSAVYHHGLHSKRLWPQQFCCFDVLQLHNLHDITRFLLRNRTS